MARLLLVAEAAVLLAGAIAMASSCAHAATDQQQASCGRYPPLVSGLSFKFYKRSCPDVESIVRRFLKKAIKQNIGLAAALLRLHFHDCFVQGCDASLLLSGTGSEQKALPNLTLRPAAFKAVNEIRDILEEECGLVVSCADIVALAARDSVHLSGGPNYKVPLGRRDGLTPAPQQAVLDALPPPTSNVTTLLRFLDKIDLDINDLVALSGGHTIGIAHCTSFDERLFPQQDPVMDKWFASRLKLTCPVKDTDNTTVNDIRTPNVFDNKYYVDLLNRQGLFTSDQDMYTDRRTKPIVTDFALDQWAFFDQFVYSMVKMGEIQVLTGSQGQIRTNCSVRNVDARLPLSVVETVAEAESLVF